VAGCQLGDEGNVNALLAFGADPILESLGFEHPAEEDFKVFPLTVAALAGHLQIVKRLLTEATVKATQATTDTGCTPLYCCAHGGHVEITRTLLECDGVDVNVGRTDQTHAT
jgi:ankyrin repeat protein